MAGVVRQPIDITSLSRYIEKNVTDIRLPISIKQVPPELSDSGAYQLAHSLIVPLRTIKSDLPDHRQSWP